MNASVQWNEGKMTVNDLFQKILGQYEDICGKAKGFYLERAKHQGWQ